MDRWACVKFCEKIRLKCKKGPFTTQAETTLVKMPQAEPQRPEPKRPVTLHCDSGKSREFIEKTTQKHSFRNNSTTFSETIPQQHFFRFRIKDHQSACELNCLIKMMSCL